MPTKDKNKQTKLLSYSGVAELFIMEFQRICALSSSIKFPLTAGAHFEVPKKFTPIKLYAPYAYVFIICKSI